MINFISRFVPTRYQFLIVVSGVLIFLSVLDTQANKSINNSFEDIQFHLRGTRDLDARFMFVFIGDEDIKALGGWPISRDYYSYAIHVLKSSGAKVIGLDVLLDNTDKNNPEYDRTLSSFLQSADNVVLPMMFNFFSQRGKNYIAAKPIFSRSIFRRNCAGNGFSNLGDELLVRKAPICAVYGDTMFYSFGAELARLFNGDSIDFSRQNEILLNHFGRIHNVKSIGFVDLLQTYRRSPDSLNLQNKLVLIGVTAQGVVNLKATPLSDIMPGSLIHLTVAENLLKHNFLTKSSVSVSILVLVFLTLLVGFLDRYLSNFRLLISGFIILIAYWVIGTVGFQLNFVLPLFYPTGLVLLATVLLFVFRKKEEQNLQTSVNNLLKEQIAEKEKQLQQAEVSNEEVLTLRKELSDLKSYSFSTPAQTDLPETFGDIVCSECSPMKQVLELVNRISDSDLPVLIVGDTGTGKEMIARDLHQNSGRKTKPFIAINCGALSETLLDSELFGHEKGSFTGALTLRRGRFELADGGSIFLDEITETSPAFQAKLLRVLQEGTFERVGGERTLTTSVRVIAATNKDIRQEIEESRFRTDLYYRLNGVTVQIPSLKERQEDIPLLARYFIQKYNSRLGISDQSMDQLVNYKWPGNVRELENVIRRAVVLAEGNKRNLVQTSDLPPEISENSHTTVADIHQPLEEQILKSLRLLQFSHSAISQTAKQLGGRDRGTVTEYFRGLCFEYLFRNGMDSHKAAEELAHSNDHIVVERVKSKIEKYLKNIDPDKTANAFKGLPQKYHAYLEQIIKNLPLA